MAVKTERDTLIQPENTCDFLNYAAVISVVNCSCAVVKLFMWTLDTGHI